MNKGNDETECKEKQIFEKEKKKKGSKTTSSKVMTHGSAASKVMKDLTLGKL